MPYHTPLFSLHILAKSPESSYFKPMIDPLEHYHTDLNTALSQAAIYKKLANRYSLLRLVCLLGGIVLIWYTFSPERVLLFELELLGIILLFFWLVKQQFKHEEKHEFFNALATVNQNEINGINNGQNNYSDGAEFVNEHHPYSSDLDIFGAKSIYALINRCSLFTGKQMLAKWLSSPASHTEVVDRQAAVRELAEKRKWRMELQAMLFQASGTSTDEEIRRLFLFLEGEEQTDSRALKLYLQAQSILVIAAAVTCIFWKPAAVLLLLIVIVNSILEARHIKEVNALSRLFSKTGKTFSKVSNAFKSLETEEFSSSRLRDLQVELRGRDFALSDRLRKLSRLISSLDTRLNFLIGPILIFLFAWDVRQLLSFRKWKAGNREPLMDAFTVIAEYEALISLASLHGNYAEYSFPELVDDTAYVLQAEHLGHPLIDAPKRVVNDYDLGDNRRIDIITGSNMAGKSTFLRTLGVNIVLALSGTVVCASRMRLSSMQVFSYMRIKDSLNDSISTFRAELIRLEMLLTHVRNGDKIFFLIDEMLRGTNSADKYKGSKAIIEYMVGQEAVGIVATHDLQISELENVYPGYVRNFYFDIQVAENDMNFDYKLRRGACKTFNASMLLRQLGLEIS